MEPEEVRAEIARRKQAAKDLKLRETVWSLYKSQFKYIDQQLRKDPELILPEVRESLKQSKNANDFRFNGSEYGLVYTEGKKETDRRGRDETDTKLCNDKMKENGRTVFEFKLRTSVTYAPDEPIFGESMGEITAFIDGAWVAEVSELNQKMRAHFQDVRKRRNAPAEAERLKQEMKRFGLSEPSRD